MIIATTEELPGKRIQESFGLVRGNAVRARHLGKDIGAAIKGIVGGEITEYTKLMGEVREQALDRMCKEARARGANAVVALRFANTEIAAGAAEILAYGTAVRVEEE
ncbi:MAG: hypothetical protein CMJ84_10665 [Planctomycetes bacterium]|jgi:uncharacterized protein YbjQ (UPF0145 family)|nr:hypothetical protein [Planctomycetota bacterium]MDP6410027.1 heavy metal-binding domain-containing protein [Planctomycetota bacterium]